MTAKIAVAALLAVFLAGCAAIPFTPGHSQTVTLYLKKPDARKVQFASSLDNFQLHDTRKTASGRWEVRVPKNAEFHYFYIVDGKNYVPDCRYKEKDDFGSKNCVYLP